MATIGLGWGITGIVTVALLGIFTLAVVNEAMRRATLTGFRCHEFLGACNYPACVDLNYTHPPRMGDLSDWSHCAIDSGGRVRGNACIFDFELWRRSSHRLGYDFCWGATTRILDTPTGGLHGTAGNVGKEFKHLGGQFTGGAYIFEDSFEEWLVS